MIGFWIIILGCFISFFGIGYQCAHDVRHRNDDYDDGSSVDGTLLVIFGGVIIMFIGLLLHMFGA